jgi:hypothetical protein
LKTEKVSRYYRWWCNNKTLFDHCYCLVYISTYSIWLHSIIIGISDLQSSIIVVKMDQYEELETIGTGAFGKVCKVKRKADDKILVWKELNYGTMNEQEKQQLVAEVSLKSFIV